MKLDFSNNRVNYLVLYTAGTGGEIITYALSQCVPEINAIPTKDVGENRWFTKCKVGYCRDRNLPWEYVGEDDPNKDDLYKDHYDPEVINYWDQRMTVLGFHLTKNFEYWTNLAWQKLNKVENLSTKFVENHVGQFQKDLDALKQYKNHFANMHLINIDGLHESSGSLIVQLQRIFPNLDTKKFKKIVQKWIKKNNKVLQGFVKPIVQREITQTNNISFDLDIVRTSEQRIEMILHPDCPDDVLEIVALHDTDQEVLEALYRKPGLVDNDTPQGKRIKTYLRSRLIKPTEVIDAVQENMLVHKDRWNAFCPIPWNHLATNADGSIRMCCQMINSPFGTVYKEDGTLLTGKDDITKHRNSPVWKQIRKEMMSGIDPEICKLCTNEETNGIGSKRQWTRKLYTDVYYNAVVNTEKDGSIKDTDFPITYMDLRFGNKCNLKCRSCGPTDSSLWYDDWVKLHPEDTRFNYRGHNKVKIETLPDGTNTVPDLFDPDQTYSSLWKHIMNNLDTIKRYYFTGGEPTINLKHRELLDYYIDKGTANQVTLDYNTNMAGVPSAVFKQWKHFKQVNLGMSIDGINKHFEFIRHPGKFSTVLKNMRRVDREDGFEKLIASITLTLSIQNVLHYPEMQWWMKEQNWNRIEEVIIVHNLYGPDVLNIQNLPVVYKKYIDKKYKNFLDRLYARWDSNVDEVAFCRRVEQRCKSILTHMWDKEPDEVAYEGLWPWMERLDKIRNESWQDSLSDIAQMIKDCDGKEI
tara:strand:+ start:397 stop:2649 length:2253 start_codon:yes stop_codon:yes gene_type:complete